jgi:ubiquinone/menaquinone biosynthesis C-methylase UbiE
MQRLDQPEEMDRPDVDPGELGASLDDLARINVWLGGWWSVRSALAKALPPKAWRHAILLDVATGGGDIARRVARARRAADVRVIALDLHPVTLAYARQRSGASTLRFVQGDALALPLRTGCVDLALCSLAAHHFSEPDAVRLLSELRRVSRGAVVVTDLRRSAVAWLLIRLLTGLVWRSRIVRHDGPVSVRRAYTPAELASLAERAGLRGARVFRQPLYRMALVYRTDSCEG